MDNCVQVIVDVGNSTIVVSLFNKENIIDYASINLDANFESGIISFFSFHKEYANKCSGALISSVAPNYTKKIKEIIDKSFNINSEILSSKMVPYLKLNIECKKEEIGGDILADLVGANIYYGSPCAICDLGTVNKFLVVDQNGYFIGSAFTPGFNGSIKTISSNAELIPNYKPYDENNKFTKPRTYYGKNTKETIDYGIYYSTIASLKDFINNFRNEFSEKTNVIITGGTSNIIKDEINIKNCIFDPLLTLKGINYIYIKSR